MKDEKKEIIKNIIYRLDCKSPTAYDGIELSKEESNLLLDYITNLQEKLEVSQTNEETYRLEMEDITKILGLDEDTIFDEAKEKATNLQEQLIEYQKALDETTSEKMDLQERNNNLKEDFKRHIDRINELTERNDNLQEENERLNNIINELEKELKEGSFDVYFCSTSSQKTFKSNEIIIKAMILDKLKELKEGKQ